MITPSDKMILAIGVVLAVICKSQYVEAAFEAPSSTSNAQQSSSNFIGAHPSDSGILSFPLLTHDHVVNRRRRELKLSSSARQDEPSYDRIPRNHNLRQLASSSSQPAQQQLGALYQGYGTHYIDIWVGYPAQRQTAVVDTGSSVTAFPCTECTDCGRHTDEPFNETASGSFRRFSCSSTGAAGQCVYGECNGNGMCIIKHDFGSGEDASSWTAFEAEDVAYAGGPHDRFIDGAAPLDGPEDEMGSNPLHASEFSFPLTFGCQTSVSGYFEKQLASGVMGMDRRAQSFWGQMRASQVIHRAQFSLCFVRQPIASISGTTAGAVTLGGVDTRLHTTPMVFAKAMGHGSTASFKAHVRKFYLRESGGTSVMYDGKSKYHALNVNENDLNGEEDFNFDSGTTDTYFTKALSDEFRRVWHEITRMQYTNEPVSITDDQLRKLPTIILQMVPHEGGVGDEVQAANPAEVPGLAGKVDTGTPNDVMLSIPPTHYMQHNARDGTYTSRIYLDRDNAMGSVLGANAMMGHNILFDMDAARIGFAESECDYARLVAESGTASALGVDGSSSGGWVSSPATGSEDGGGTHQICGSLKCRGLFGLTMTILFILFFCFARRYVTKRDDGMRTNNAVSPAEFEMKASSRSRGEYSDSDRYAASERGGYRDKAPPSSSYSDAGSSRASERSSRHHGSRRGSSEDGSHRSQHSSRGIDRSYRSTTGDSIQSHHSSRSQRSSGTHHSSHSHRTSESHRSSSSHRSGSSRGSNGSGGSRESHRSRQSSNSHRSRPNDRYYSEGERSSSRRDARYSGDYDDDIPMPPSIS